MPAPTHAVGSRPRVPVKRTMRQEGCDVPADEARPSPRPPACESSELLRGAREVLIRHGGEVCRLRHTRNDKLILTK